MTTPATGWTHHFTQTVPAAPERVFAALTEPDELRAWFAEGAAVEPREGGAYQFWGRHTWGTPARTEAAQKITRWEPGKALAFEWPVEGMRSTVTLELTPVAAGDDGRPNTAVALRHAFPAKPAGPYPGELIDDLWRFTLGNLDAHLRGGAGIVLPDYADPNPEIRLSMVFDAPRDLVFRALLEPAALDKWVSGAAEVEPRIGGRYRYGWKYEVAGRQVEGGPTTILDLVPNERLVTDWLDWRGDGTRPVTRVAWILEDADGGARLTLVHDGFSRTADVSDYPFGWPFFMGQLRVYAQGRASVAGSRAETATP